MVTARGSCRAAERSASRQRPGRSPRRDRRDGAGPGRDRGGRSSRCRPTTSGWIGNSRWPRSTRTARRIRRRPAEVADRVQGRADGPAREQDVVDQDDLGAVDAERDLGAAEHGPAPALAQVVAVERDIDGAHEHLVVGQQASAPGPAAGRAERRASARRPGETASSARRPVPDLRGHARRSGPRSPRRRRPSLRQLIGSTLRPRAARRDTARHGM